MPTIHGRTSTRPMTKANSLIESILKMTGTQRVSAKTMPSGTDRDEVVTPLILGSKIHMNEIAVRVTPGSGDSLLETAPYNFLRQKVLGDRLYQEGPEISIGTNKRNRTNTELDKSRAGSRGLADPTASSPSTPNHIKLETSREKAASQTQ